MPGTDRTGPEGMGPMTGRGAGYCGRFGRNDYGTRGHFRGSPGAGHHWPSTGPGGPRRWLHWACRSGPDGWRALQSVSPEVRQSDPESEEGVLKARAQALRAELESINRRLEGFESAGRED